MSYMIVKNKNKKICLSLIFTMVSFCLFANWLSSDEANAEELEAMCSGVTGTVEIIKAGEVTAVPAQNGMILNIGDTIRTGDDGSTSISFLPKNVIQVSGGSELTIEEYMLDEQTYALDIKLNLTVGRLMAVLKDLPPESNFEIKSPTAVAAVRGTVYYVGSDGRIYVEEGSVTVTNLLTGDEFVVFAGQFTVIREDGTAEPPREASAGEVEDLVSDFTPLEAEPYEPPERPGIVITPNVSDPFEEPASGS
ncbi:MAG: FecR family protein [Candidatus Omnitrophota bacterium]|nr:FecR family protein [Candidatus Omnitrophota bacterium]